MQDLTPDPDLPFELRLGTDDLIASGDLSTMGVVSAASGTTPSKPPSTSTIWRERGAGLPSRPDLILEAWTRTPRPCVT